MVRAKAQVIGFVGEFGGGESEHGVSSPFCSHGVLSNQPLCEDQEAAMRLIRLGAYGCDVVRQMVSMVRMVRMVRQGSKRISKAQELVGSPGACISPPLLS